MFSCCRANPEKDSSIKQKNKKDKQKKNTEPEQSTENNDKKLIIPTITIENGGKLNDDTTETPETPDSDVSGGAEVAKSVDESEVKCENNDDDVLINQIDTDAVIEKFKDRAENPPEDALDESNCQGNEDVTRVTVSNFIANSDGNSPISTNEQHLQSKSSLGTTSTDDTNSTVIMQKIPTSTAASSLPSNKVDISQSDSYAESNSNQNDKQSLKHHHHHHNNSNNIHQEVTPKSCLSRHNSTHVSIKKKVNICNHAEIIEPDPLPPPPYDHPSLADDDDVFSDSLPPPKRESMCAPYIERDDDPETLVAFAHGLPEWFNDERINDTGCVEPPVTPVGRDELEMKRHRLYSELLRAAHAAVEHSVRFDTLGPEVYTYSSAMTTAAATTASVKTGDDDEDCDPDLKPSVAENLEHLVNRLERLVERLERSISARELEIANKTFDSVLVKKRESFDLETTDLPPIPPIESSLSEQLTQQTGHLNQRIERIETTLNKLNDSYSNSQRSSNASHSSQQQKQFFPQQSDGSLENIPTVLEDYQTTTEEDSLPLPPPPEQQQLELSMSVLGYQDIVNGPFSQYLSLSAKIGGDVAKQANLVKSAFDAQLKYVILATQCSQPSQDKQMDLLKPTSTQISAIQDYREKNRASPFFNHLSAISESIPALGWVCVAPTPGPHVKEMNDAGQFYTNRVLKEWKEKDTTHVEWARAWIQTLTELQQYIKQYHTTGLVWSGKGPIPAGGAAKPPPPPPIGSCPPPPPPPAFDLAAMSLDGEERNALFAEINQGEAITKNLKRVTADMQTHKNPTLRTGPAPFKAPTQTGAVGGVASKPAAKEPVFTRDGKKWLIEHQKNNPGLLVENAEMNNVVYVFKCEGSTLTVKGKVNNIVLDSCKKCSLLFDSVVASIEFVNCQSVQMQVLGFVPTVIIDKTDGCQMYLSNESLGIEIVSSKSSEMNVMLPATSGDYTELAVPEQYKTTISGKSLKTVCVDSLG